MKKRLLSFSWLLCLVSAFALAGCESEDSPDNEGVDEYFDSHPYVSDPRESGGYRDVVIDPSSVEATYVGQKIHFDASGGRQPYNWDVSNPSKGSIDEVGKSEAVYTVNSIGPNSIIAYDQRGHAAIAEVTGPEDSFIVSASRTTLNNDNDQSILQASGGVAPYSWSVTDSFAGDLQDYSGSTVVYIRANAGNNTVKCTDSEGAVVNTFISQP